MSKSKKIVLGLGGLALAVVSLSVLSNVGPEKYSCAEIGQVFGESAKCVAARISRTRKYLKAQPALAAFHSL